MMSALVKRHLALGLLAIAAFMAPIIGGQLLVDIWPIDSGFAAAWRSIVTGAIETPTLSHCLVGLFVAAAVCVALARFKVIHLPSGLILGTMIVFGALLALSLAYTEYRASSIIELGEWVIETSRNAKRRRGLPTRGITGIIPPFGRRTSPKASTKLPCGPLAAPTASATASC